MSTFYSSKVMGRYPRNLPWNYIRQAECIAQEVKPFGKSLVAIDIGCGAGESNRYIRSILPTILTIGLDVSSESLATAMANSITPVVASADGASLPFRSKSADIVIANEIIEHLVHTDEFLREIRRVLSPEGYLCISTPNLGAWFNRLALLLGIQPAFSEISLERVYGRPGSEVSGHLRLTTVRAFYQFMEAEGFEPILKTFISFDSLPHTVKWLDRLFCHSKSMGAIIVSVFKLRSKSTVNGSIRSS